MEAKKNDEKPQMCPFRAAADKSCFKAFINVFDTLVFKSLVYDFKIHFFLG